MLITLCDRRNWWKLWHIFAQAQCTRPMLISITRAIHAVRCHKTVKSIFDQWCGLGGCLYQMAPSMCRRDRSWGYRRLFLQVFSQTCRILFGHSKCPSAYMSQNPFWCALRIEEYVAELSNLNNFVDELSIDQQSWANLWALLAAKVVAK